MQRFFVCREDAKFFLDADDEDSQAKTRWLRIFFILCLAEKYRKETLLGLVVSAITNNTRF